MAAQLLGVWPDLPSSSYRSLSPSLLFSLHLFNNHHTLHSHSLLACMLLPGLASGPLLLTFLKLLYILHSLPIYSPTTSFRAAAT